jgi:cytochrome c oxidase cbb3-type subunit 4
MDINDVRAIITVLSFIIFAGICWWAFSSRRASAFSEAARLPFLNDDLPTNATKDDGARHE